MRDHPRSRGEHHVGLLSLVASRGSSPLARGARSPLHQIVRGDGIIPARAGSTPSSTRAGPVPRDHPRSRGEHLEARRHRCPVRGIIPARAGSTLWWEVSHPWRGDHPRSRGEHELAKRNADMYLGSSPLARGAPHSVSLMRVVPGIIPARAGSTGGRFDHTARVRDHPRSRGEHLAGQIPTGGSTGSSPLARGAPTSLRVVKPTRGIIPARAGSTTTRTPTGNPGRDHPRSRGEHAVDQHAALLAAGSSPLARGAPNAVTEVFDISGIIPARAGSTVPRG